MTVAIAAAPPAAAGLIERRVRAGRRQLWAHIFAAWYGDGLICAAVAALGWGGWCLFADRPVLSATTAAILIVGPLAGAAFATFCAGANPSSLRQAAAWIDGRARTHDRFQTALAFAKLPPAGRSPFQELALAECANFVAHFDVRPVFPIRLSTRTWAALFPLVSLTMLALYAGLGIGNPPHDPALAAAVNGRADALEKLAARVHRGSSVTDPDLDRLADEMRQRAARLKRGEGERVGDQERRKQALQEISALEARLNAMKAANHPAKISPGEFAALAAALAMNDQSRAVAESLKNGKLGEAAGQLEKLAEQLKQQGNASQTLEQLAQSMQEQAAKLTEQERNDVAREMQQAAQGAQSGQPQLSQQALQRLADLLRSAGRNGQWMNGSPPRATNGEVASPMTEKQLQDLINALENMKEGLRPGEGADQFAGLLQAGKGDGHSLVLGEFPGPDPSVNPLPGQHPSGLPGGEHDVGHPDKLYGDHAGDPARGGVAHRLEGLLGEGESLQELIAAGGGSPAKAGRRYKELYNAMAPAAQETVEQENIPLGSRFFIRRYFENIRPGE